MKDSKKYKNFISKENYIRRKKDLEKKENSGIIIILIINIIISFKVVNIFNKRKVVQLEVNKIGYGEKANLINWIKILDMNIEKAKIDNGSGEIIVRKDKVNEMLNKFEIDGIQVNDGELAELKIRGMKYGG
ncbi:MAG: hypothetical protein ACRC30_03355 [Clostridium sp.]